MQEPSRRESPDRPLEHQAHIRDTSAQDTSEGNERKPWRPPQANVLEVAKITRGPGGIGTDLNGCHS